MSAAAPKSGAAARIFSAIVAYLLLSMGTLLMLKMVLLYSSFDDHTGFLQQKQAYLPITIWKVAFYIHVFSSIVTLLAGFTQFSPDLLRRRPGLHRWCGRIYVWDVLLINVPAGMIMAIYANGHLPSKLAFAILDSLWFWFTLRALVEIKRGNVRAHRNDMMRSYALTLSALSLRTWKIILTMTTDLAPETIYMIDAWLGFLPNWLCAEWIIRQGTGSRSITAKRPST